MSEDFPELAYATKTALAGLASEVEALRRDVEKLPKLARRIESIAGLAVKVSKQVAATQAADAEAGPVTWLALPADVGVEEAEELLAGLAGWMAVVYLRYADAARTLPDCWLWHPDVVEELLWLSQSWDAAYYGEDASIRAVGDWHDRQRPGVVARIKTAASACSIEAHQPDHQPRRAPAVPVADASPEIAAWWAQSRTGPPPAPTADQLAAATAPRTPRGRR